MHPFTMPPDFVARVVARGGREHSCESLHGPSTALVVVDMQNYYMLPGQQAEAPVARSIVPNVNALARAVRAAEGHVIWIQTAAPRHGGEHWPSYQHRHVPETWARRTRSLTRGDVGYQLWPELEVRPGDRKVVKTRFSALLPGSSDLEMILRAIKVDTLLIAGVATNVCCESTARDAVMLNFHTVMVSDANAATTDAEHAAALGSFYLYFGDVRTSADVLRLLADGGKVAPAAA